MRVAQATILGLLIAAIAIFATGQEAIAQERSLYVHYTHTKETEHVVFKRNGRYVQDGLNRLNHLTRDWRRDEPTRMDPALWDLLWEVYQEANTNQPIHIVSGYRAPATNAMLASNSSGVANNSQHMQGKALDFFIPGVPASKLREIGFRKQVGGVGYYPSSGNPFVHLDVGTVRAWPRMTTAQLQQIFPDGRTLHIPSNGQVLSQQGRQVAQADWERCRRVPCGSGPGAGAGDTRTADSGQRRTLMDLFSGGNRSGGQAPTQTAQNTQPSQPAPAPSAPAAPAQSAAAPAPAPSAPAQPAPAQAVASADTPEPLNALPPSRPNSLGGAETAVASAPAEPETLPFAFVEADSVGQDAPVQTAQAETVMPNSIPEDIAALRAQTPRTTGDAQDAPAERPDATMAIAALDGPPPERPDVEPVTVAYAAPGRASTGGLVIEQTPTASAPTTAMRPSLSETGQSASVINGDAILAASFSPQMGLESFAELFEGPILPRDGKPDAATANAMASLTAREGELHAPDLDHVTETLLAPVAFSSAHYAYTFQPDNADLDPATQLGEGTRAYQFKQTASIAPSAGGFGNSDSIWVRFSQ